MRKRQYGQFFTKNVEYIIGDLVDIFPEYEDIVDPFAGEWDLLNYIPNSFNKYGYDIDPKNKLTTKIDSLKNQIDFSGKWIFTNPPYLAKNKNKDKTIYDLYNVSDLYKAALINIKNGNAEGGIIIVPLNFFCDKDKRTRCEFLSQYTIKQLRIFEEQVFEDTSYTVCSFSFVKKKNEKQEINTTYFPLKTKTKILIDKLNNYEIGNDINDFVKQKSDIKISRLLLNQKSNSNIILRATDSGSKDKRIGLFYSEEPYYGKDTDRCFASVNFSREISQENQKKIISEFNNIIEKWREKYNSMFLTTFRNSTSIGARKRIEFKMAFEIISAIIKRNNL